jgi:hypothetical protein
MLGYNNPLILSVSRLILKYFSGPLIGIPSHGKMELIKERGEGSSEKNKNEKEI